MSTPRNVVWIVLDTLRADHVGAYAGDDAQAQTPVLDALAHDSLLFEQVFPESMPTLCIRRAMYTGRRTFPFRDYHVQKGDLVRLPGWQAIPEEHPTGTEILRREGFRTALFTDTYHYFKPGMNFHRGFDEYHFIRGQEADPFRTAPARAHSMDPYMVEGMRGKGVEVILDAYLKNVDDWRHEEDHFAPQVFSGAMRWLEANRDAERFFMVVDCFDPHEPWDPPSHYVDLYDPDYHGPKVILPMYGPSDYLTERQLEHMRALYAGEVTMVDRWLGHFLDRLAELGLDEDTLVMVTSDHGHSLGEHGIIGKIPWGMYPELMDSILMVKHPGGERAGERKRGYVAHHDMLPATLGMLEITPPAGRAREMNGRDIWADAANPEPVRTSITSAFKDYAAYRDDEQLFICRFDGSDRRLYLSKEDPELERNRADELSDVADRLYAHIKEDAGGELPTYEDPRSSAEGEWYQPSPWSFDEI